MIDSIIAVPVYGTDEFHAFDVSDIARLTNFWLGSSAGWRIIDTYGHKFNTTPEGYVAIEDMLYTIRESDPDCQDLSLVETAILDRKGRVAFRDFVCIRAVRNIRPHEDGKRRITVRGVGDLITSDFAASQLK